MGWGGRTGTAHATVPGSRPRGSRAGRGLPRGARAVSGGPGGRPPCFFSRRVSPGPHIQILVLTGHQAVPRGQSVFRKPVALPRQLPFVQNPFVFASVARLLCLCLSCAGPSRPRSRPRCPTHVVGVLRVVCRVRVCEARVQAVCADLCTHDARDVYVRVVCLGGVCPGGGRLCPRSPLLVSRGHQRPL